MTGKRLAAFVVTILMIGGAIFVRSRIDNNASSATDGPSASSAVVSKGVLSVVCSTEFAAACQDLDAVYGTRVQITIEPAGNTLDRLVATQTKDLPELWITLAPFPAMLDESRERRGDVVSTEPVTQTAPRVILQVDRASALQAECLDRPLWKCIGDFAGTSWADHQGQASWGTVRPGFADPGTEALGLITLANIVSGYFNDVSFSRSTWEADDGFLRWLGRISSKSNITSGSAFATMATRPSALSIAATDSAEISITPRASDAQYTTLSPSPTIVLQAQIASFTAGDADLRAQVLVSLQNSLTGTYGWETAASSGQSPSAGTFVALRQLWKELS